MQYFIAGMGKVKGKFDILLDIQRDLSVDKMAALASVGGQADADTLAELHRAWISNHSSQRLAIFFRRQNDASNSHAPGTRAAPRRYGRGYFGE